MTGRTGSVLVTGCICKSHPFDSLLSRARSNEWGLDELMRATGAGTGCGLCRPYLRRMLRTGETAFTELLAPDAS